MAEFRALGLAPWLAEQARQVGLLRPTPVQAACIPAVLQGRDCLGCAQTGSGKTAAFVLPVLHVLAQDPYGIFCLVLTPTRELAYQIAEQFRVLGKPLGLKDCVVVGGLDMVSQALALSRRPHVVVATPGRLADHLRSSSTFSLSKVQFLVLDEADRLLEQGSADFSADLELILGAVPARRQTLLFSATLTGTLRQLRGLAANSPFCWEAPAPGLDIPAVQLVINHNTPGLPKIYIHRVGRTARAGRQGLAITLVTQYDIHLLHAIEEEIKLQLPEFCVEEQLVLDILTHVNVTRRECEIELEGMDFDEKKEINKRKQMILEGKEPELCRSRSSRERRERLQQRLHRRKLHRSMERRRRKDKDKDKDKGDKDKDKGDKDKDKEEQ